MTGWIWALIWTLGTIYVTGFVATFAFHIVLLQMVTPPLAFLRALVWPLFWLTGWPGGEPV